MSRRKKEEREQFDFVILSVVSIGRVCGVFVCVFVVVFVPFFSSGRTE